MNNCRVSVVFVKFICICLVSFFTLLLTWPSALYAQPRNIKVGIYQNSPKIFLDSSGRPAGIFIEILESIAREENWSLQFIPGTWGDSLDRLESGEIDLMPDVSYSAEREKIFAFHREPVLSDWFQVYARKGSGIKSIVDLSQKRIVVLERSVQQASFEQLAIGFGFDMTLIALPDYQTIFECVAANEADAAVTNRFYGQYHARHYNLEDTAIVFNPTKLYFAAPSTGDPQILAAIDRQMIRMKKKPDSEYYRALQNWTTDTHRYVLPDWIKLLGGISAVVLIFSLVGSVILKRQVDTRTRELQEINREMEERIIARTRDLENAMKQARAADQIKSSFLATMSHELRTPLNSIIGFTGILLQGLAGPLNAEQGKQLGMVQTSARHLLALINDVLDISKIEAGQLTLSETCFELQPSLVKLFGLVAPMAEKKGLMLKMDVSEAPQMVVTDQRRLEQIVLNLLNNALKFTERGEVLLSCHPDGDDVLISVRDTGIGIDSEDLSGLFEPFHQIDSSSTRKHEGTGLGLSICRKLIEKMKGSITVESRLGQGSKFSIRFPGGQEIRNDKSSVDH